MIDEIIIKDRIDKLIDVIIKVARGRFSVQAEVTDKNDELDSLAMGINMMIDEIRASQEASLNIMEDLEIQRKELNTANKYLTQVIKERKKAENAVKESEKRYRTLFEASPDGILIIDVKTNEFKYANPSFCYMLGYSEKELKGMDIIELLPKDQMDYGFSESRSSVDSNIIKNIPFAKKDGTIIYTDANEITLSMEGRTYNVGFFRDVTEKKLAEEKLEQTMRRLSQSNSELEQFAYVASHDLQEPLRMITSYLQLIAHRYKDKLDKNADEFIYYATDGAYRMQKMINDLLTYSRISTKEKECKPINCKTVFEQALCNLQETIKDRNVEITHDSLPEIFADDIQISRLLQNLISNAIKYNVNKKPEIHVSAEKKNSKWIFSVKDNGIGIGSEHKDKIFKIFQRLHTKDQYTGTGIGLAVCRKIVEQYGGSIWVESKLGRGSIFYFTLPLNEISTYAEVNN